MFFKNGFLVLVTKVVILVLGIGMVMVVGTVLLRRRKVTDVIAEGLEVDDGTYFLLVFPDNRIAQISTGFNVAGGQYAEISGTAGMLRLDKVWNNGNQPVTIESHTKDGYEVIHFEPTNQFALQLQILWQIIYFYSRRQVEACDKAGYGS